MTSRDEREALVKRGIDESIEGIAHCSMLIARIESEKMRGNFTESDSRSFVAFHESIRRYRNNLAALTAQPSAAGRLAAELRELIRQIDEFVAEHGEASFYTGDALAVLDGEPPHQ